MNPMTDGIEEVPSTSRPNGIQNHTTPMAAPITMEAVGTMPTVRGGDVVSLTATDAGGGLAVTATMCPTYGVRVRCDTAFSAELAGG
ncbi:hypothetical protein MMON_06840 [Mycolicibacterium monacense]|uniref:Uncharacterized protein n=1 Tax=Mycolicibacterium monacense TaxID=85693 RepID=A0AAD1ISM4_MYCMB|nr:hypothetical protein MMON_06840 [Mycolicibacterium monacense]